MQTQAVTDARGAMWYRGGGSARAMVCLVLVVIIAAISIVSGAPVTWAQQGGGVVAMGYVEGKIMAVQGNKITLNGTVYELDPNIEVFDPEGTRLEASSIAPRARARIQVKREQPNRIVKMVLTLPQ